MLYSHSKGFRLKFVNGADCKNNLETILRGITFSLMYSLPEMLQSSLVSDESWCEKLFFGEAVQKNKDTFIYLKYNNCRKLSNL